MKSGLASALMAIRVLQDLGWRPAGDVIVESVVGEESGGCGTLMTIIDGIHADGVVILEPTAMALCPVQSGALTFRLTVAGRAAHGAMRQHGVSAIEKFALIHRGLLELERDRHAGYRSLLYPDPDQVAPISIGTIRGGDWHSTVPESVIAEGRFGVFPGETVGEAREALERRVAELSALDPFHQGRVLRQPWVERGELGHAPVQRLACLSHRFARKDAEAPLRDDRLGHRAVPVPAPDRADADRCDLIRIGVVLKSAIRDDNPVIFIEGEMLYNTKGEVPEEEYTTPIGKADIKLEGSDVTLVCHSKSLSVARKAADQLVEQGVKPEILDLRTIRPLDTDAILASVAKTHRCVIVEEGWPFAGVGAQVAYTIQHEAFDELDAPIERVTGADVPMPYNRALEKAAKADPARVIAAVEKVLYHGN